LLRRLSHFVRKFENPVQRTFSALSAACVVALCVLRASLTITDSSAV